MKNKIFLLLFTAFFILRVNAQDINLVKNYTQIYKSLPLPIKVRLVIENDTGVYALNGLATKYEFPFLTLINKKNMFRIDVRKIAKFGFTSPLVGFNYIGAFILADFTIGFTISEYKNPILLLMPLATGCLTYVLIRGTFRKLDTKTKWSFY